MVLGHKNQVSGPGRLRRINPLVGIELGGIKDRRAGFSAAPLLVGKSVQSKMNDYAEFQVLPFNLLWTGSDVAKILRCGLHWKREGRKNNEGEEQNYTLHVPCAWVRKISAFCQDGE
jgi:hypothetical protein